MRTVKYKNATFVETATAMNLQVGKKSLATARKITGKTWLLKANGFCWIDAKAREPNSFGFKNPDLLAVNHKVNARHELQKIALMI